MSLDSQFLQDRRHQIALARRNAPRQDKNIGLEPLGHQRLEAFQPVASNTEIMRRATSSANLGHQHRPVAVANLTGTRLLGRIHDLVSGRQNGDAGRRMSLDHSSAHGGKDAKLLGPQYAAGLEHDFAPVHFPALGQNVLSRLESRIFDFNSVPF
jgi:hypothetical protein